MLLSSKVKDLDEGQKYLATFYLSVSSSGNLHAKRNIDHAFKTKTKTKRANLTKTKQCVGTCGVFTILLMSCLRAQIVQRERKGHLRLLRIFLLFVSRLFLALTLCLSSKISTPVQSE